ncbi:hypothetical protein HCG49_02230 [Arenibacter sp. 6A1]|uniref:hypothetical protein n=1 Tax=Arenibacter sp. 6A1 TaxID=2720391 RepID=UPI001445D4D4|nr:hypothetical protein [Arenibacter sp. 6A1]NKI25375.1 hypothetical protein [Arenibacter sp. 6A1]
MKQGFLLILTWFFISCGGNDAPKPPDIAMLVFPEKNSECTTGIPIVGSNSSLVTFRWQASNNTESYTLRVTHLNLNTTETVVVTGTTKDLPLEKGAPYSWQVISKNTVVPTTAISETWFFYNAGTDTSHAPFPVTITAPKSGATVLKDINNQVLLAWEGADIDNDLEGYDVYFSTVNPPQTLAAKLNANSPQIKVNVAADTVYYWQIVSRDQEGNTATNSISEFKVR